LSVAVFVTRSVVNSPIVRLVCTGKTGPLAAVAAVTNAVRKLKQTNSPRLIGCLAGPGGPISRIPAAVAEPSLRQGRSRVEGSKPPRAAVRNQLDGAGRLSPAAQTPAVRNSKDFKNIMLSSGRSHAINDETLFAGHQRFPMRSIRIAADILCLIFDIKEGPMITDRAFR
jgi:hypothetical protein